MTADARFWDDIAEKYAAQPVGDPAAFEKKIATVKSYLRPDSVVLNVGCGTGSLALRLAPYLGQVHGLDISPQMLRIARDKAQGVDNVHFHQGTVDQAPFQPESLDGVNAFSILHLVEDRQATLKDIYNLIKPGGFFIASTVVLGESWMPYPVIMPVMKFFGKAPYVSVISTNTLLADIERAGFVNVTAPDVGCENIVTFTVARKPA